MSFRRILAGNSKSLNFISLKAKLIIAILSILLGSTLLTGYQALRNGQQAHKSSLEKQLVTLREAQLNALNSWKQRMQNQVAALAVDPAVIQAMNEFSSAYNRLENETFDAEITRSLETYYREHVLNGKTEDGVDIKRFYPKSPEGQILQYDYISSTNNIKNKATIETVSSRRYYDGVHAYYHSAFRKITQKFGFNDMYLVSLVDGSVVYSVNKRADFGTRLIKGPYETTSFGHLFADIRHSQIPDDIRISDYSFYSPDNDRATAFIGTTLFDENQLAVGVLIFSIHPRAIDKVLAQQSGISGKIAESTETLVVGDDKLLRSNVRFAGRESNGPESNTEMSAKACYAEVLQRSNKLNQDTAKRICGTQLAVLLQSLDNEAVTLGLNRETGLGEYNNYRDETVLVAYAPFRFGSMNWAVMTQVLASEVNQPVYSFQRNLLVSFILIICAVTFLSMLIAYLFVNPISRLTLAAKKLSRGETDIEVDINELDEYGELGRALQQTGENLKQLNHDVEQGAAENRKLLRNTLPDRVIRHHLAGEQNYLEPMNNTAVLFLVLEQPGPVSVAPAASTASLNGTMSINQAMEHLYQIAAKNGAEYIRVVGGQLIAGFGFRRSRMDYTNRCLQCAKQLQQEMRHFNFQHETGLELRIGIHSAPLAATIIYTGNDRHFSYDLVGPALNGARKLAINAPAQHILLSDSSFRQLPDNRGDEFEKASLAASAAIAGEQGNKVWSYKQRNPEKTVVKPSPVSVN